MSLFDHLGIVCADYDRSLAFYQAALAPLGIKLINDWTLEDRRLAGFGVEQPAFWIGTDPRQGGSTHIAFLARDRAAVDAFHAAALKAGGKDNGGPGTREMYHPNYYAAFVFDPDGNNIEAVCHDPE